MADFTIIKNEAFTVDTIEIIGTKGNNGRHEEIARGSTTRTIKLGKTWDEFVTNASQSLGFDVLPSLANFVLAAHPRYSGEALTHILKRHNILVRSWSSDALLPWVRITVGTHDQQLSVLAALSEVLSAD